MAKINIKGVFNDYDIEQGLYDKDEELSLAMPKHQIPPHPGFETKKLPNGEIIKIAYNKFYNEASDDLTIELKQIRYYESRMYQVKTLNHRNEIQKALRFHYRRAISLISPKMAAGWNRWSENILELFVQEKTNKVLWGSGNCGKSAVMAVLLYTKWRANPSQRAIVIASRVVKEASARVFGYIKDIHQKAPACPENEFRIVDGMQDRGIYTLIQNKETGEIVRNENGCIVPLPVKITSKGEAGANLIGRHPDDRLILAFDEAQELPSSMLQDKIFANWLTNTNLDVYVWGNPNPVDYHNPQDWDILFKMGADKLSLSILKTKERDAKKTGAWQWSNTVVLRFTMLDSPKDDPEEKCSFIISPDGTKKQRLHFLGGKENVEKIAAQTPANSPAWYSQVLGFPFIHSEHGDSQGVLSAYITKEASRYPLLWGGGHLQYFMGVDPAVSGTRDACSIVVARAGQMEDGRVGIDFMGGEGCRQVQLIEGKDFTDTIVETMYALSKKYNIPLRNIAVETHGIGEVLRYSIQRHIEAGKWRDEYQRGERYYVVNPMRSPTDRPLFKQLGFLRPAKEVVADAPTEHWVAVRCLYLSRQIFNVPEYILKQFYTRTLGVVGGSNAKFKIETKMNLKARGLKSPNDADALCNVIDLMRERGVFKYMIAEAGSYDARRKVRYEEKKGRISTQKAFGIVSRMLQIDLGLGGNNNKKRGIDVV